MPKWELTTQKVTDFLRSHVTGGNDAINEVGQTTAVSLVGTHHGPGMHWDTDLGHLLVVLLGNDSLRVWISMTYRGCPYRAMAL
jgi:hypothetical protein